MEAQAPEILTAREQRISRDKIEKYKGTARVFIEHLTFPHPCRQVDSKIVERLKRDFEGEGCLKTTNRIPAIIDDTTLQAELQKLAIDSEDFRAGSSEDPPRLSLGLVQLECLHGQHRILAAKEFLIPSQRWWIVDLYSTELESETKQALREGYSYSAAYASGDVFRHMRLCYYNNDLLGKQRWRARLSDYQARYFDIILKRSKLLGALDSVLHIQGLWRGFYVGSLNHFISLGCDDEIAHAIGQTKRILTRIFGDDMATMMATASSSIESIQSRSPALSKSDFRFIQEHMRDLFPGLTDPERRSDITRELLATEEIIPSLWMLISDIRYLEQPAKVLNSLLPAKVRNVRNAKNGRRSINNSLLERFRFHFQRDEASDDMIEVQRKTKSSSTALASTLSFKRILRILLRNPWDDYDNVHQLDQVIFAKHKALFFKVVDIRQFDCEDVDKQLQILSRVQHPNVASIYDIYCYDEQLFLIMEHLDVSLSQLDIRNHQLEEWETATIISEILKGVAHIASLKLSCAELSYEHVRLSLDGELKLVVNPENVRHEDSPDITTTEIFLEFPILAEVIEEMMLSRYHLTSEDDSWSEEARNFLACALTGSLKSLIKHRFLNLAVSPRRLIPRVRYAYKFLCGTAYGI